MDRKKIETYIEEQKLVTVAQVQKWSGGSYYFVRKIFDRAEKEGRLEYLGGTLFAHKERKIEPRSRFQELFSGTRFSSRRYSEPPLRDPVPKSSSENPSDKRSDDSGGSARKKITDDGTKGTENTEENSRKTQEKKELHEILGFDDGAECFASDPDGEGTAAERREAYEEAVYRLVLKTQRELRRDILFDVYGKKRACKDGQRTAFYGYVVSWLLSLTDAEYRRIRERLFRLKK